MTTAADRQAAAQRFNEPERDPRVVEIGRLLSEYLGRDPVAGRRIDCEQEMAAGLERLLGAFAPELKKGLGKKLLLVLGGRLADLMGECHYRGYALAREVYKQATPAELDAARAAIAKHGVAAVSDHVGRTGELPR